MREAEGQYNPLPCFSAPPPPKKKGETPLVLGKPTGTQSLPCCGGNSRDGGLPPPPHPLPPPPPVAGRRCGSRGPQQPVSHQEGGGGNAGLCPDPQKSIKEGKPQTNQKIAPQPPWRCAPSAEALWGCCRRYQQLQLPQSHIWTVGFSQGLSLGGMSKTPRCSCQTRCPCHQPMGTEGLRPPALDLGTHLGAVPA